MDRIPDVIAHRGYTAEYPENTIPALLAAVQAGAPAVEIDIQFSRDRVPVVFHDADLRRMTGAAGLVGETELVDLKRLSAHEPGRLGDRHHGVGISTLEEAAQALADSNVTVFVEIKRETLPIHDIPASVKACLKACRPLGDRIVIISFDPGVLQEARSLRKVPIGWVLPAWGTAEGERARALKPEYLFCDQDFLPPPPTPLWDGAWHWVVYEVNDVGAARQLLARGVGCIETKEVPTLLTGLRQ